MANKKTNSNVVVMDEEEDSDNETEEADNKKVTNVITAYPITSTTATTSTNATSTTATRSLREEEPRIRKPTEFFRNTQEQPSSNFNVQGYTIPKRKTRD